MKNSKKGNRQEPKIWYKLDLSAIVYPTLQRRDFSSVYRLSVVLKEPVKADILQQAADIALTRFPTYKTAIRKGLFWRSAPMVVAGPWPGYTTVESGSSRSLFLMELISWG